MILNFVYLLPLLTNLLCHLIHHAMDFHNRFLDLINVLLSFLNYFLINLYFLHVLADAALLDILILKWRIFIVFILILLKWTQFSLIFQLQLRFVLRLFKLLFKPIEETSQPSLEFLIHVFLLLLLCLINQVPHILKNLFKLLNVIAPFSNYLLYLYKLLIYYFLVPNLFIHIT